MINALFHRLLLPSVIQLAVYFKEELDFWKYYYYSKRLST